eukprot:TRINITY_DN9769_c0_g1_i6.p1 TRINITY_DN9769_c0_g1~~TRINITY_DN9769_c0_g1_i6.p1  ORF type:complete len:254 (-),score=25.28 TRINITY_DN9769_c0_g1_i6:174-935(-)
MLCLLVVLASVVAGDNLVGLGRSLIGDRPSLLGDTTRLIGESGNLLPSFRSECRYDGVSIAETATAVPELSILVEALQAAGLVETLADKSFKGTVFAPTNPAFRQLFKLLGVNKAQLLQNTELLTQVLLVHVVPDVPIFSKNLFEGQVFETLQGGELVATAAADNFFVFSPIKVASKVVTPDVAACNSVVHVIDRVLLPSVSGLPAEIPVPADVFEVPFPDNLCRPTTKGNLLVVYRCEKFGPGFLKIVNLWS